MNINGFLHPIPNQQLQEVGFGFLCVFSVYFLKVLVHQVCHYPFIDNGPLTFNQNAKSTSMINPGLWHHQSWSVGLSGSLCNSRQDNKGCASQPHYREIMFPVSGIWNPNRVWSEYISSATPVTVSLSLKRLGIVGQQRYFLSVACLCGQLAPSTGCSETCRMSMWL